MEWVTIDMPTDTNPALVPREKGGGWQWGKDGSPQEQQQRQDERLQKEQQKRELAYAAGAIAAEKIKAEASKQGEKIVRSGWDATKVNIQLGLMVSGVIMLHGGITWLRPIVNTAFSVGGFLSNPIGALISHTPSNNPHGTYRIETSFLYDDSPPGAWDFTLFQNGSSSVPVPSPCDGMVAEAGWGDRAGNHTRVNCVDGSSWFMAHYQSLAVNVGDRVTTGQSLGIQGTTGNSTGDHVHLVITPPNGDKSNRTQTKPLLDVYFAMLRSGQSDTVLVTNSDQFDAEQMATARQIIAAAKQNNATERETVALLMTAMQESSLRPNACCDHDSVGILQQRVKYWPSANGGISGQVEGFLNGSGTNPGFRQLDNGGELGAAIQSVQRSAHPGEYSKWESAARELLSNATPQTPPTPRIMDLLNRNDGLI